MSVHEIGGGTVGVGDSDGGGRVVGVGDGVDDSDGAADVDHDSANAPELEDHPCITM